MTTQEWQKLKESFKSERCVLILGPGICSDITVNNGQPLYRQLAVHLSERIKQKNTQRELLNATNLGYVAKIFENTAFVDERATDRKARQYLGRVFQDFYRSIDGRNFGFYKELLKMKFPIVINANPDNFLRDAIVRRGGYVQSAYFNYKKPQHNVKILLESIDKDAEKRPEFVSPNRQRPLIYNIFGNIDYPESLVITESDKIRFAEEIMQREATASLPTDLRVLLKKEALTFLFIGFDFERWHLRILLHILELDKQEFALALQNPADIDPLTHFLYNKHFLVDFQDFGPVDFFKKLKEKSKIEHLIPESTKTGKRLFIMYSTQDEVLRQDMEKHLVMLRKNNKIDDIWHEGKIHAGSEIDSTISSEIDKADVILMMITANFLVSDKIYENQLLQALYRHENHQACIIPVIMKPCDWEDATFGELFTILPRDTEPISLKADRPQALKEVADEINEIIDNFDWEMKN